MSDDEHPLWRTLRPVAAAVGGELLPTGEQTPGDIPLEFEGETVGVLRLQGLDGALGRLIETIERELGDSLANLSRTDKQIAVRLLTERGAFLLRKGVEDVAAAMGVSRITIYNYLNAMEQPASGGRDREG
ncbi:MAG: helix-turn-helix domain-containing protein [bacterium]|nr:helix-turn-helix domain-containing protein [bacterium]MXV90238.1 transcriptional regulator [Acidimicrobiia bacterium]MYC46110.1 transcriptional regulator [Acidimicrobiia bacterium]MYI19273.1 transcriptional regulator [Acidimicrobiia bacterium]